MVPDEVLISPSAGKPALVIEKWMEQQYDIVVDAVEPATRDDFWLAHDHAFVDGVLALERPNGFGNRSAKVADTLPWTTGSLITAAVHALKNKTFACSPTSGFHHAAYMLAGGFCTFNGLAVTAIKLKNSHAVSRVGILDLDHHHGDGTEHIIRKLKLDFIQHYSFGGSHRDNSWWKGGPKATDWIENLPAVLEQFSTCDIVLYQASADPHVEDPLGGALTSAQLRLRDRTVFNNFAALEIPLVWNIAGGYQNPIENVLDVHNATVEECLAAMI